MVSPDPSRSVQHETGVNLSSLSWADTADIALQRTAHLLKLPGLGSMSYNLWKRNRPFVLHIEARLRQRAILDGVVGDLRAEFLKIQAFIGHRKVEKLLDIGCGHGIIDFFFYDAYKCSLHLVDIEATATRHHDFHETGAGYASLQSARKMLIDSGVPPDRIRTTNPSKEELHDSECDLIISLLSCGFHYPVKTYSSIAYATLKPGGMFVCDLRKGTNQETDLAAFSEIRVIDEGLRHQRVAAMK